MRVCVRVRVCVCLCVHACVRACRFVHINRIIITSLKKLFDSYLDFKKSIRDVF